MQRNPTRPPLIRGGDVLRKFPPFFKGRVRVGLRDHTNELTLVTPFFLVRSGLPPKADKKDLSYIFPLSANKKQLSLFIVR